MSTAVLGLRLALALVFAAAAAGKLSDRPGSLQALRGFGVPERLLGAGAWLLPLTELAIAAALISNASALVGAACALALLAGFIVAIGRAMVRGESPDCHCFGQLHSEPAGRVTLARNGALAAAAIVIVTAGPGRSLTALSGQDLALLLTSLATVALATISAALWRENRQLRKRPAARRGPLVQGLPTGTRAPDITLTTLDGATVSVSEVLHTARPAALVQLSPSCGPCKSLLPELSRWQQTLAHQLSVIAVSSGELDANRAFAAEHGLASLYLQAGQAFADAYQVRPTPSAVLIDEDGRVAGAPATGAVAIEALIRLALARLPEPV